MGDLIFSDRLFCGGTSDSEKKMGGPPTSGGDLKFGFNSGGTHFSQKQNNLNHKYIKCSNQTLVGSVSKYRFQSHFKDRFFYKSISTKIVLLNHIYKVNRS